MVLVYVFEGLECFIYPGFGGAGLSGCSPFTDYILDYNIQKKVDYNYNYNFFFFFSDYNYRASFKIRLQLQVLSAEQTTTTMIRAWPDYELQPGVVRLHVVGS